MLLSSIGLMSSTAVLLLLQHEVCEVAQTWPELVQAWNAENLYVWMGVCFGREREGSVWSVLDFVFNKKCVRVMSDWEVGYKIVIEWSIGG